MKEWGKQSERDKKANQHKGVGAKLCKMWAQFSQDLLKSIQEVCFHLKEGCWNIFPLITILPCLKISPRVIKSLMFLGGTCLCARSAPPVSDTALQQTGKTYAARSRWVTDRVCKTNLAHTELSLQLCWDQRWDEGMRCTGSRDTRLRGEM